jgi:hypothetical protein
VTSERPTGKSGSNGAGSSRGGNSSRGGRPPADAGAGKNRAAGDRSKPRSAGPSSGKPPARGTSGKPSTDRPTSGKPRRDDERTGGKRPPRGDERGGASRPRRDDGPASRGSSREGARPDTRRPSSADRPRDPIVPEDVSLDELDLGVFHELKTLPEGLGEIVGKHLVAADRALVDGDVSTARAHIAAAKRRAGRVGAVREAAGITAYLAGDFAEAAAELRTVRRMTGSNAYVPMLADCERGLGRPQRALEIIREVDARTLDTDTRVELMLVAAGARSDLGQLDAAIILLQGPDLTRLPRGGPKARLQYAYADLLEQVGRFDESREWMIRAAESDIAGVTDAAERVEEEAGLTFMEEELESED